jgi:predicted RNA methylase
MSADDGQAGCRQQQDGPAGGGRREHPSMVDLGVSSHADALVDIFGDIGGRPIVDLGCGVGHFGREMARGSGYRSRSIDRSRR